MADDPLLMSHEQEQQQLLAIVQTWHPSALPEYRGFRCALCQAPINEAWYHWLKTDEYHLPVHLCQERCEPLFQTGAIPLPQEHNTPGARAIVSNVYPFPEETTKRFQEIVNAWPTGKEPELCPFTCDACGGDLALEEGPDGSQHRQGYHVWWRMEPGMTLAELHFHRTCGQSLGIYSQAELKQRQHQTTPSQQGGHPFAETSSPALAFRPFDLPTGERALIPNDLDLQLPEHNTLGPDQVHFLVSIPWNDRYLSRVAEPYRAFFLFILPYLHTRTTDVHVATCFPFVRALIEAVGAPVDSRVVHLSLLLHDVGWSQLSEAEIMASLGTTGVALTETALAPKAKHALVGRNLAQQLLEQYPFVPPLTDAQKAWIAQAVLYHDKPWEVAKQGTLPVEMQLVCDADHLWSVTHENFWQDTVRKGVAPPTYLNNLERELDAYFVTEPGKAKARTLWQGRQAEVREWTKAKAALEAGSDATVG